MIVVHSSVWIDLLQNADTPQARTLTKLLDRGEKLAIADLVLVEVLRGALSDRSFDEALRFFAAFPKLNIIDHRVAADAARNYRSLRARGITIRKIIDVLIATRCIVDDLPLLYRDRVFASFVQHLGLRSALADFGAT